MKRLIVAAALLAAAPFTMAQTAEAPKAPPPDVPKPDCGTPPELPGPTMMQDASVRKRFETDVSKFKDCMKAYVDARQAAAKANADAGNDAVNQFNAWAKALDEEQQRRRSGGTESQHGGNSPGKTY